MTQPGRSILVISPDAGLSATIGAALEGDPSIRIDAERATLVQMNGRAVRMAADYDMVLFQTDPGNPADLDAIATLASRTKEGTLLVALADSGISLSQARAISDAGVDEVLPIPASGAEIGARLRRLGAARTAVAAPDRKTGRVIAVAQARGGVGATTVAANLADQLLSIRKGWRRAERHSVALVDLDLQFGTIGAFLDLPDQDTLLQMALEGILPDAHFLAQSMPVTPRGLGVLAAPSKFAPLEALRTDQVAAILDGLRQTHDYVVVDLPRALVGWIEPVLQRADKLMLVTDISVASIRHCRRLIDFLTADHVALPVEIVVNGQARPLMPSRLQREAERVLERRIAHWLPSDRKAAGAAADRGQPLSVAAPRSALTKALGAMARTTCQTLATPSHTLSK